MPLARPIRLTLLSLPLLLAASAPGLARSGTEAGEATAYARDNTVFTLYHEFGHLFVDRFALPVLAREEDAVDNLATLMALDDYETAEGGGVLGNAVYGWELAVGEDGDGAPATSALADSHSLNAQRAFTMVCLLVGKDKAVFGAAAGEWGMDDERQDSCAEDYRQARSSWDKVLADHEVGTAGEGEPIEIVYEEAGPDTAGAKALLESARVLETFAARMEAEFSIPEGVVLKAADCGEDNAYYDSDEGSVTVCYELVNYYLRQYAAAPGGEADEDSVAAGEGEGGGDARYYRGGGPILNERRQPDK